MPIKHERLLTPGALGCIVNKCCILQHTRNTHNIQPGQNNYCVKKKIQQSKGLYLNHNAYINVYYILGVAKLCLVTID